MSGRGGGGGGCGGGGGVGGGGRGRGRRFRAELNPSFAAAHGIQTADRPRPPAFRDTALTADQAREDGRKVLAGAAAGGGPHLGVGGGGADGGVARPGRGRGRLEHALRAARATGRLNLADCGLSSPLPDAIFDLRAGVSIDLSMDRSDADVNPWEVRGEEAATLVDLSDNDLSDPSSGGDDDDGSLDERVWRFRAVQTLRARRCRIRDVPWTIVGGLDQLALLDLSGNGIASAPLQSLPMSLRELDLSCNKITSLCRFGDDDDGGGDSDAEIALPCLVRLDVTDNELAALPGSLRLSSLQTLRFGKNRLTELSEDFIGRSSRSLSTLEGPENVLSVAPDLSGCRSLRIVDLCDNRLETAPKVHESLVRLALSDNQIASISGMFGDVDPESFRADLQELRLRDNKLSELDESVLRCLTGLTLLDLGENDLSNLPPVLGYLPKLRRMPLDRNPLKVIRLSLAGDTEALKRSLRKKAPPPPGTGYLESEDGATGDPHQQETLARTEAKGAVNESLVGSHTLDLSNKGFAGLPDAIVEELRAPSPSGGMRSGESATIGGRVSALRLSHNGLRSIGEAWIEALPNLTKLDAGHNKLESLPGNLGGLPLTAAELNRNWLVSESIAGSALCRAGEGELSPLARNLVHLNLSSNSLEWVPAGLLGLPALSTLILSHNRIRTLAREEDDERGPTGWRPGLPALEALNLSGNRIEDLGDLPPILGGCCLKLRTLLLGNNELRTIPPELGLLQTLNSIDLRGNPQRSIRPAVLDRTCGAVLSYLRSRMDAGAVRAARERMRGFSSRVGAPAASGSEGPGGGGGMIAPPDVADVPAAAGAAPRGTAAAAAATLSSPLAEDLRKQIDDLTMQLNNVHLTEAKKYAMKKTLAMHKAKLMREERRLKTESGRSAP